jgi:alkylated DNA repair dioxygenase AlkB
MELFTTPNKYPAGFQYIPGFISREEEVSLLREIKKQQLHVFNFHGYVAKRKVASFGYDYSFTNRTLTRGKQIPHEFKPLIEKVSAFLQLPVEDFAELLLTEYPIGSVINWHRDAPPFDVIAGISLQTDCIFKLRPYEKEKQVRGSAIPIAVERRSLYIIQDESRTNWEHSISPVKEVRYSITLRTLRGS